MLCEENGVDCHRDSALTRVEISQVSDLLIRLHDDADVVHRSVSSTRHDLLLDIAEMTYADPDGTESIIFRKKTEMSQVKNYHFI